MPRLLVCLIALLTLAADATPPKLKIIPGQVIVPTDNMRRIWGELVSLDPKTRTGKFRNESTDEVMPFTIMPYAELLHHAALGDLQDYRVGERAIFRLHPNEQGDWVWLTYIQDEMNFLNGHKEYYHVDRIDAKQGILEVTDASADKSYIRQSGILLEVDEHTRYWKDGQSAALGDIRVGNKLRTKTHGLGQGKHRRCWEVFLDEASLLKFQTEQQHVHRERMQAEGLPGYVDRAEPATVEINLFPEGRELIAQIKPGMKVSVAPCQIDRRPARESVMATIREMKAKGRTQVCTLELDSAIGGQFTVAGLARVWVPQK